MRSLDHIVVIGLGYVGLPLALALAKSFRVTGLDIDAGRIAELRAGHDRTNEVTGEALAASTITLTDTPADCAGADVYIVTVPTPVDGDNRPDLRPVLSATRTVAALIRRGTPATVVYESTVYPGVTEEICGPLLAEAGGLVHGRDFALGYSPERINPGDREHTVDRIVKVIAGETPEVLDQLTALYGAVTSAGVFPAASIKAAEAAKVIENAQRDINIAFMNEVTQIFSKLDVSIWDVLAAARTKWNFLDFRPGLVGGHCIGVDPYYLSHRAEELGCTPRVILAGRGVNDGMADWVAQEISDRLAPASAILCLGVTFKENVPDLRNSKVVDLVRALERRGHRVTVHDPHADAAEAQHEYALALAPAPTAGDRFDAVIGAVAHDDIAALSPATLTGLVGSGGWLFDLKRIWDGPALTAAGARYWTL